jgi:hypothetical protein
MVDILGAALTDGLDAVEDACAEVPSEGVHSTAVILNILARRRGPPPPLTIATPEALRLTCEPVAASRRMRAFACRPTDCARYDSLRRADHGKIGVAGRDEPIPLKKSTAGKTPRGFGTLFSRERPLKTTFPKKAHLREKVPLK